MIRSHTEKREPLEMAFGFHAVAELLGSGAEINKIMVARERRDDEVKALQQQAREAGVPVQEVPKEKLNTFTRKNHQGIIAFISPVFYHPLEELVANIYEKGETPLLVLLDRITDVRNLGAIARSASCANAHGLILPMLNSAQVTGDAIKTSAGALANLPVCRVQTLNQAIDFLLESGFSVVAASEHAAETYYQLDMTGPLAIVMGSEEDGLSPATLRKASHLAKIPIVGTVGSLNVSVAAGVLLFEAVRQRLAIPH
jgi:23S rRNA (guanosine2251-2'-O)-methyltransferase